MGMKVWYNGSVVEEPRIPITCHALHYGTGVFEGIRCYKLTNGKRGIFRLSDHIKRLFLSAKVLKMDIKFAESEIREACKIVIKENGLSDAYIRPIVFYNFGRIGLNVLKENVDVAVFAIEFPKYLEEEVRVKISSYRRMNHLFTNPEAKISGHYFNSVLATLEAKEFGYDEALMLDSEGNIAEGPGENIFFIKGETLITPPSGSILQGITRDTVLKFAKDLGFRTIIRNVSVHELECFDEAFFTGTAAEITPIKEINSIKYATSLSKKIQKYYQKIVRGEIEKYEKWIEAVE